MSPPNPPRPLVVLGIDPGTLVVGYGAVVDGASGAKLYAAGVLRAPPRASVPVRLARLRRELDELVAKLAPAVVVVEQAFAAKNVRSALRIGEARGVALACAAAFGADVVELAPAAAKKSLVGHGAADKRQVARMVATVLGVPDLDLPLDASDALALALAHVQRRRFGARSMEKRAVGTRAGPRELPAAVRRAAAGARRGPSVPARPRAC